MAGEIEEPFRLNFQADTLHSGSISFGRFETEALCWERRSSFSHNRYLEEVEKYSKPGSVTEKKAYFEAHFRKRGHLGQSSSECLNGMEYQSSENDISESTGYDEHHEHEDEGNCTARIDQSSHGSVHDREHDVTESESKSGDFTASFYELQVEPASDTNGADFVAEHEKTEEANLTELEPASDANGAGFVTRHEKAEEAKHTEFGKLVPANSESKIKIEQSVQEEGSSLDTRHLTTVAIDLHPNNLAAVENNGARPENQAGHSVQDLEGRVASGIKHMKPRLTPRVSVAQEKRNMISETPKGSGKPRVRVNDTPVRSKAEKKTPETVAQNKCSMRKMHKYEVFPGSKEKVSREIKSTNKESGIQKASVSRPSSSQKTANTSRQSANRLTQAASLTPGMRRNGSEFSSRSGEHAERRKEYHMKSEGKAHAKETEIDQVQAKSQEKEKAEIKQLRRSLNFKATPMPSFYHRAGKGADISKATESNAKTRTPLTKPSSPGIRISERSSSSSGKGTYQTLSISKSVKSSDSPFISGETSCYSTVTSDSIPSSPEGESSNNHPIQAAANDIVCGTKQKEKDKRINIRSHKVPEVIKIYKGPKVDGKQKPGNGRHSYTGLGSSSRTGRLAVGVAS